MDAEFTSPAEWQIEKEYAPTYAAWQKDPSPENSSEMLRALRNQIGFAVRTHGGRVGSAKQIVLDALPKYDPKQGQLRPFLNTHLQTLIRQAQKDRTLLKVPQTLVQDRKAVDFAEQNFVSENGRPPSSEELARAAGFSMKRLQKIRSYKGEMPASILQNSPDDNEADHEAPAEATGELSRRLLYDSLDDTDKIIMEHTLGMFGRERLTGRRLASKLGISAPAVSQRAARIQARLDRLTPATKGL